jgi:uncharacterized membrane protein
MFYVFMISAIFWFFPYFYETIKTPVQVDFHGAFVSIIGLAVIGSLIACTLFNYSIRIIGGRMASVISIVNPLTTVLIGLVLLNEKLASGFEHGVLLIVIGTILVSVFETKQKTLPIEEVVPAAAPATIPATIPAEISAEISASRPVVIPTAILPSEISATRPVVIHTAIPVASRTGFFKRKRA